MNKEYCNWEKFEEGCQLLASQIFNLQKYTKKKYVGIFGIPRGGLCVAVRLSHITGIPVIQDDEMESILIVDDVSDTGKTLKKYTHHDIATLYKKPQTEVQPNYCAFETEDWIVFPWEEDINGAGRDKTKKSKER